MAFPAVVQMNVHDAVEIRTVVAVRATGVGAQVVMRGVGQVRVVAVGALDQPIVLIMQGADVDAGRMGRHMAGGAVAAVSGVDGGSHLGTGAGVAAQAVVFVGVGNNVVAGMADHTFGYRLHLAVSGVGMCIACTVAGFAVGQGAGVDSACQDDVELGAVHGQVAGEAVVLVDSDDIIEA